MNPFYSHVVIRAGHRCEYCQAPADTFNFRFEVEHIFPVSRGGTDDLSNLALACRSCNQYKSNRINGFDDVTQANVRLFNPRLDTWSEHFVFQPDTSEIVGLTPIGRVTATLLRFNSDEQLVARQRWVVWQIFP